MLNETQKEDIRKFVRSHVAVTADAEPPNVYFRGRVGRSVSRGTNTLAGVYASKFDTGDALAAAVCDHVGKTWACSEEPRTVWLTAMHVGENNPVDVLPVVFESGQDGHDVTDVTRRSTSAMDGAAAMALLDTNRMLKDMVIGATTQNRELLDIAVDARVSERIATATLEVVERRQSEIRFERMLERLDPHLDKWFPALIMSLGGLAAAYASKDVGPPPADDEQRMADWHIERVIQSVAAMGLFFETKPELLTEKREKRLGDLLRKMMMAFQEMKDDKGKDRS